MGSLHRRSRGVRGSAGEAVANAVVDGVGGWGGGRRDWRDSSPENGTRLVALLCAIEGVDESAVGEICDETRSSGVLEIIQGLDGLQELWCVYEND